MAQDNKNNDNNNDDNDNKTNNDNFDDVVNKFIELQKSTKLTLKQILLEIRKIDLDENLTIGKYHDPNQQPKKGFFGSLFGSSYDVKKNEMMRDQLCGYSIFASKNLSIQNKKLWVDSITSFNININRAVGCMVGMGVGDAVGHPLEFVAITDIQKDIDQRPRFDYKLNKYFNEMNRFQLQRGQWTDDAAMGLCQADSLIINDKYDGSDIRIRFWNWWQNGYNNAFRKDKTRASSVGLGGNISSSIYSCKHGVKPASRYIVDHDREDSGNGSLMRLAPLPVYYHDNINNGRKYSFESSFTTHPGYIAGESCSLLAYIIINAIHPLKSNNIDFLPETNAKKFMNIVTDNYKNILVNENIQIQSKMDVIKNEYMNKVNKDNDNDNDNDVDIPDADNVNADNNNDDVDADNDKVTDNGNDNDQAILLELIQKNEKFKLLKREYDAKQLMIRLISSNEAATSKEYCWNWKSDYGSLPIIETYHLRAGGKNTDRFKRQKYNGYPVNAGYWGSYCMDGLAMGMHCAYHSDCFADAIEKCVNLLGDADSTGSIGGQISGAIYGYQSIIKDNKQKFLVNQLVKWDDYDFAFRGVLLYILGDDKLKSTLLK